VCGVVVCGRWKLKTGRRREMYSYSGTVWGITRFTEKNKKIRLGIE